MSQYTYAAMVMVVGAVMVTTAHCQLPDAPSATRVADRNFLVLVGVNAGATLADAITTAKLVGHTEACPYEVWSPALYGREANDARVYAVMGAQAVAATGLAYVLKRYRVRVWRVKLWTVPLAWQTYAHGSGAVHNLRVC